ncbi:MAG: hypothetical protein V3T28_11455 [Gemmatimonadales bacterium]
MRALLPMLILMSIAAPLAAQDSGLKRPDTWQVRFDRPGTPDSAVHFVEMAPGWHIRTGPAAILYDPARTAEGSFAIESETYLFSASGRREAFGVLFGGRDLAGPNQTYLYFLIRGDGSFLVKSRHGRQTETLVPWTRHAAILPKPTDGSAKNVLKIVVGEENVEFFVNDTSVASVPRAGLECDGIVGLRLNHRIDLHVTTLEVTPG